jgi:Ca2+/H+ antiporter
MSRWNRSLFWNPVSIVALLLVALGLVGSVVLAIGELASAEAGVYRSLFAWVIFPAIGWLGLLLCLGGVLRKRHQQSQISPEKYPKYFQINFSQPRTRHMLFFSAVGLLVLLIWGTFTSYHAYEFTESTAFCASACHSVMQPERVTHQISPHAAVSCSACHVGKTPTQYLEAKIFGLNELYRVATNSYERPIPTPTRKLHGLPLGATILGQKSPGFLSLHHG